MFFVVSFKNNIRTDEIRIRTSMEDIIEQIAKHKVAWVDTVAMFKDGRRTKKAY